MGGVQISSVLVVSLSQLQTQMAAYPFSHRLEEQTSSQQMSLQVMELSMLSILYFKNICQTISATMPNSFQYFRAVKQFLCTLIMKAKSNIPSYHICLAFKYFIYFGINSIPQIDLSRSRMNFYLDLFARN